MHPIIKLVSQRLALGLLLLFGASALIFGLTEALPGDAAQAVLGQSATPEALANLREEMGLNRPALTRYFEWLGGIVQGDLGQSLTNKLDIAESIGKRLGNTLFLACAAAVVSVPLAIFLGLLAVRYRNRWPDKLISAVTLTTVSIPEFLIGYVVIYYVSVKLGWFSSLAMINDSMSFGQKLNAIALPAFVLTLVVLGADDAHDPRGDPQPDAVGLYRNGGTEGVVELSGHCATCLSERDLTHCKRGDAEPGLSGCGCCRGRSGVRLSRHGTIPGGLGDQA